MINSKSFLFHLVELCDKFVGLMKAPTREKKKERPVKNKSNEAETNKCRFKVACECEIKETKRDR